MISDYGELHTSESFDINNLRKEAINMEDKKMAVEEYVSPEIEVVEIVCQNTPDWTHGSGC